jgi:predicted RNA-binding Zn ribbon-like protein
MGRPAAYRFDFSGGALCLDFANTIGDRPRNREEHLGDWRDLVAWAEQAGVISRQEAARAGRSALDAERAFAAAVRIRNQMYGVFSALAAGRAPARRDLSAINAALGEALAHARVEPRGDGFAWGWTGDDSPLDRVRWAVVRSAGDLLVSPEQSDVRECASGTCSWLFLDRSPTHRRRWCSMKTCGNRDKVRRFHARRHAQP